MVEVKTTDAYRMSLDRLAEYRQALAAKGEVEEAASSTLIVVGRKDTGELEAQIRGSRHAWSMRLVSVDALFNVLKLIDTINDDRTIERVCDVLRPREYTRVDGIIELAFAAARDAQEAADETVVEDRGGQPEDDAEPEPDGQKPYFPTPGIPAIKIAAVRYVSEHLGLELTKKSRSIWASAHDDIVLIKYSKYYPKHDTYWYGYHPHDRDRLDAAGDHAWVGLICGAQGVLLVRASQLHAMLADCYTTELKGNGPMYWHLKIHRKDGSPAYFVGREGRMLEPASQYIPLGEMNSKE